MILTVQYLTRKDDDPIFLERLAYTLCQRRSLLDYKEAVSATTSKDLIEVLSNNTTDPIRSSGKPELGFIFTGQGAQWNAMGRELYCYTEFAEAMHELNGYLEEFGATWSLLGRTPTIPCGAPLTSTDELQKDHESSLIDQPYVSQPATTAIQIALTRLLSSWNIKPSAVVGHSSGEIAAAYAAGALPARSCMLIAYRRGTLAETLDQNKPERPGRMLAVGASQSKVRPMVKRLGSAQVVIACVNGPSLVTASGDERGISRLQSLTEDENLLNKRLKVNIAYHSPHMNDISAEYLESLRAIAPSQSGIIGFHSSVRGQTMDTQSLNAEYWVENMTSPVLFSDGVESMYKGRSGPDVLIEIGPHNTLESPIRDILKSNAKKVHYLSTLSRGQDATVTALSFASTLSLLGCDLDFGVINHLDRLLESLATYQVTPGIIANDTGMNRD